MCASRCCRPWWYALRCHAAGGDDQPAHGRSGDEQPADEPDQSTKQVASHRVNVDFKLLIDHVSALEYATECATSEAYNTIFTAQASSAVQPREALLAAMAYGKELEPQHRQRPDARPPASERELKQTEATASAGADTAGACV